MSEPKLISPMLDNFVMGDPISEHNGVRSCPAMDEATGNKYIVKIISSPASPSQLDALLLSGAYTDRNEALAYYEEVANGIVEEIATLKKLSELDGFMPFDAYQLVPIEDDNGFDVYLLSAYKLSLERFLARKPMTHLGALNLGLDLCSALTVARRSGYIYVDLKPENIYLTTDNGYRIGDIGFLQMDSLKYASLPDRYRSAYTAPELQDAFATLNTTIDVYAVGLILYQAFNGGILPSVSDNDPLPPPDYADYEMAEIILKACAVDPAQRWEDPTQLGHALVDYMQRNGAHDSPIVPPTIVMEDTAPEQPEETVSDEAPADDLSEQAQDSEDQADQDSADTFFTEDDNGNLTFIVDDADDETLPGMDTEDLEVEDVSEEVHEMLNQADELIAHPAPDPVVAPDPIDVPIPQIPAEDGPKEEENTIAEDDTDSDNTDAAVEEQPDSTECDATEDQNDAPVAPADEDSVEDDAPSDEDLLQKPKRHWLRWCIIVAAVLGLLVAGYFYYNHVYVQTIDSLRLEGSGSILTVYVNSTVDEQLLTVVCSDTYQNPRSAAVENGKAVFTDLAPGSPYTITVKINGFHALKGETTKAYATPKRTDIVGFNAVTGKEDGSAILKFTIDGPDSSLWTVYYGTEGEEEKSVICADHMATISGLTVGKEYYFRLAPADDVQFNIENSEIKHTASISVTAEDLHVSNFAEDTLTVSWFTPKGATVTGWSVRCTDGLENGYNVSLDNIDGTTATFEGISPSVSYTVEVKANGMNDVVPLVIPANAVYIQNFTAASNNGIATLTWSCPVDAQGEWYVEAVTDNFKQTFTGTSDNSITVTNLIPGAAYRLRLRNNNADIDALLTGNLISYTAPEASDFNSYNVSRGEILFRMCHTPPYDDWNQYYLSDDDYSTSFAAGDKASFTVEFDDYTLERPQDTTTILYIIKDESGSLVSATAQSAIWRDLWTSYGEGELDIPALPEVAGSYVLDLYFNGMIVNSQAFTIV